MIGLLDYGAGNLRSISQAFTYLGFKTRLISSPDEIKRISRLVIPGVGSFGPAIIQLRKRNLKPLIDEWISSSHPLLGICLGLQLLTEGSEESPEEKGLAVFEGKCKKLTAKKVPQIGWNRVQLIKEDQIFQGLPEPVFFYFVHSYSLMNISSSTIAITEYGQAFSSVLRQANIYACQFHPEKSGEAGLLFLKNWVEKC
ncbi:MAG: imidazole glycerol phosphate synthase subunit HisH [Candidatus Aminicenantes bacterium]|nr:imidazole glycerol phosphate synthase subunit HisH [Candidatus Aminicenantes bacterium]